jgi:hypothetical protein
MRRQLDEFRAQGFDTIYIQARLSMPRALYLSPAYLDVYARAVRLMAGLGLRAGLYDEYAWGSGQAGGRTVMGAEHLRETHLFWAEATGSEARVSGLRATLGANLGKAARDWLHEGGTPRPDDWRLVAAVLLLPDGTLRDVSSAARLVETGGDGAAVRLDAETPASARWVAFVSARISNSTVPNYLLPETGARFVEQGLEPYARTLAGLMPDPLHCLFFDQPAPALYAWNGQREEDNLRNSLLWSDGFSDALRAKGPLGPVLMALLQDTGTNTPAIRSRVYRLYAETFQRAFFAPVRSFCRRHGLVLTGHEILPHVASFALNAGFPGIDPRAAMASDFFGTDLWRDVTAVDANNLGPQLSPVLGDSVARASGRRGCLCELYVTAERTAHRAAGQWEMTPQDLRAQLIRLHMLGANRVILHALHADAGTSRSSPLDNLRFDFPPGYNLQPWWPLMREISDEIAGLAAFLAPATPVRQVAILYPYETALVDGPRHRHAARFGQWCEALVGHGQRPLIVDEAGLAEAKTTGDGVTIHGSAIAALVLPCVTALHDPESGDRLDRIKAAGVPLWRGAPGRDLAARLAKAMAGTPIPDPVPGLRWHVAGQDDGGWWRVVAFNEGHETIAGRVRLGEGVICRESSASVAASALGLRLAPQDLRCLTLREAPATSPPPMSPAPSEPLLTVLDSGWTLEINGSTGPVSVRCGWERQGFPAVSGTGRYETSFTLDAQEDLVLHLPGLACAAFVVLDGRAVGRIWRAPWRLALGQVAAGVHHLRIDVANTAANAFYAGTPYAGDLWPDASGLTLPPRLLRR